MATAPKSDRIRQIEGDLDFIDRRLKLARAKVAALEEQRTAIAGHLEAEVERSTAAEAPAA